MFTAKIVEIKKDVYQHSQEPFLDVKVAILNEKSKVVETRKYAYEIDTPEEVIVADAEKMLETYVSELAQAEEQKASIAKQAKADKTIEALKGAEIEMPEPKPTKKAKGKK